MEREIDLCLDETEIRIEIEIEVHLWMQPALKQILKKNLWHFWMRKAKEEEKEIRGCTVKGSLSIRPKSRWRE